MRSKKKFSVCPNCENKLKSSDHFCSHCGQQNHDLKIPFWHLIEEGIESFLHVDRKALITLKFLIISPGKLSKEFNEGKRVKYIPPIRLYVLISFLFFFLLNLNAPNKLAKEEGKGGVAITFFGVSSSELDGLTIQQADSLYQSRGIERTEFKNFWLDKIYKLANSEQSQFFHSILKNISYMMFVLMPGFAFILFLFYKNKNSYYVEHLFVSIHFHSFVFLLFSALLITGLMKIIVGFLLSVMIIPLYMIFLLKNYYEEKIFSSIWKAIAIGVLHLILFFALFLLTIMVSIYLI